MLVSNDQILDLPLWIDTDKLPDLWPEENPFVLQWFEHIRPKIFEKSRVFAFWVDWYENVLNGSVHELPILEKIALIDPEDWDKGADHVSVLIEQIIAENEKAPSYVPALATKTIIKHVQASVQANGPVLALQLAALLKIIDQEIEYIRGTNSLEPDIRDGLLSAMYKLKEASTEILSLLPEAGAPSEAEAEQIASWGAVLKQQAQHWNTEAKKFVAGKSADERVAFSGRLIFASAVAGPLSLMGLATFAAVAGGAILFRGKLDISKAINAVRSGTTSP